MSVGMEQGERLHGLDAVRALAMLAGIVLHAMVSFIPGGLLGWPIVDVSTSIVLREAFFVLHLFRMALFFMLAGLFARLLYHRLGVWAFLRNRLKRIALPLVVALIVTGPLILVAIVWGMAHTHAPRPVPPARMPTIPVPLFHLWFLYMLCGFYGALLVFKGASRIVPAFGLGRTIDALIERLVRWHLVVPCLAMPLVLAQWRDRFWVLFEGIPTPAVGLVPNTPALVAYGTAFAFGWFVHRQLGLLKIWEKYWAAYLAAAILLTLAARVQLGVDPSFTLVPVPAALRLGYAACYSGAFWCWTFALIGAAQRFCADPSPRIRYLADASYWMYLIHLPIVWGLAAWVALWPIHWTVKVAFILLFTLPVLLLSYRHLVRGSIIGAVLNGRRRPLRPET